MDVNVIVCDECSAEFLPTEIEFQEKEVDIEGTMYKIVFYKCTKCGKAYVVCMLDYWGKKLQDKYISAMDKYRASIGKVSQTILKQKLEKVEELKNEAMEYQNDILHRYGDLIPEEIFQ